ncbi:hypothetical protein CAMGR0001_0446 [Campylobacter gracilis RM3268]|uniref:Uncharacterized protein n=1 Tax=Campylobacter gracilis RM3268 TaxID=553220 RepID=C8PHK1_9BACT|nr:hypothetical protein CAMGR0001_0446 [Campylobacter gracilis RM3268]
MYRNALCSSRNRANLIRIRSVNLGDEILKAWASSLSPHKFKATASDLKFRGADLSGEIRASVALLTATKF